MLAVTDSSFDQDVLKSDKLVLVDFWAEWCGPCKSLAPLLDEIDAEMGSEVTITKMNVDENTVTPPKFGIRGIPTMMLFKNGELVDTHVGMTTKGKLIEWINSKK